ncbi:MAG: TonB family protein [Bacteroidetes bacterium]|nr:TonB family protein [Bacteroidota bacterium]
MKKNRKPESFISKTFYPGGPEELRKFILSEMKYPELCLEKGIEGVVQMQLDVDNKGNTSNIKIKSGVHELIDAEAMRIASLLKFAKTHNRGVRITFHETLNIQFSITEYKIRHAEVKITHPTGIRVVYSTTPAVASDKPAESPKPQEQVYNISIKLND